MDVKLGNIQYLRLIVMEEVAPLTTAAETLSIVSADREGWGGRSGTRSNGLDERG